MSPVWKRHFVPTIIILSAILLSGFGLRAQAHELGQLLVVQTMGLDRSGDSLRLSLASVGGAEPDSAPVRLAGSGSSVAAAEERIRAGVSDEDLFCAHIGHLLIGEDTAARGIGPLLDEVFRSGGLRLNLPVYILRGGEAADAVLGVGDRRFGVCDALASVDSDLRTRGDGRTTPACGLLRDLARSGSALVCAVEMRPSAQNDEAAEASERPQTLIPAGYAVLRGGSLCGFVDRELAVGAGFLSGDTGSCEIAVTDQAGLPLTLSLRGGSAEPLPLFDEKGRLCGLEIRAEAEAVLLEGGAGDTGEDYLRMMLGRELSGRILQVLQLSQAWEADFLGLRGKLERAAPGRAAALRRDFAALWPTLPLTVSVSVKLSGGPGGVP